MAGKMRSYRNSRIRSRGRQIEDHSKDKTFTRIHDASKQEDLSSIINKNNNPGFIQTKQLASIIQRAAPEEKKEPPVQKTEEKEEPPVQTKAEEKKEPPVQTKTEEKKEPPVQAKTEEKKEEPAKAVQSKPEEKKEPPMQAKIQRQATEEEKDKIQHKEADSKKGADTFQSRLESSMGGGSVLPLNTRRMFENKFGADFSNVRIHNDDNAHKLCSDINALAFTRGNHIFFNKGTYDPSSESGQKLLAHELTHVVQQNYAEEKEPE